MILHLRIAVAVFLTSLLPQSAIGKLGDETKLAACAIAISFSNVTGLSLVVGLSVSLETFVAQANGAREYVLCGAYLQRALVIESAALLVVVALYSSGSSLFRLMRQEEEVADKAGTYLLVNIPNMVGVAALNVLMRFLLAQSLYTPLIPVAIAGLGLQGLFTYLLMNVEHIGWLGAPMAAAIGSWVMALSLAAIIAYIERYKRHPSERRFRGFKSSEAFSQLWPFFKLAAASLGQVAVEWWAFELVIVSSGWLGSANKSEVYVASSAIAYSIISFVFAVWLGISQATSSRTGNFLGSGDYNAARLAAYAGMIFSGSLGVVWAVFSAFAKRQLALLFARRSEEELLETVESIAPFFILLQVGDSVQANAAGSLRGMGRQAFATLLNVIAYYGIGVPIGASLASGLQIGLDSLWIAVLIANLSQCVMLVTTVLRTDWKHQADVAVAAQESVLSAQFEIHTDDDSTQSQLELSSLLHKRKERVDTA